MWTKSTWSCPWHDIMIWNCPVCNQSHVETLTMKPCLATLVVPVAALAQSATPAPATIEAKIAALEAATKAAQSAGDNAWMLTSAALVLMMTGPGLALFYGGLVRKKNVLATMMQSFILMALITIIWGAVGYSLAFGEGM